MAVRWASEGNASCYLDGGTYDHGIDGLDENSISFMGGNDCEVCISEKCDILDGGIYDREVSISEKCDILDGGTYDNRMGMTRKCDILDV